MSKNGISTDVKLGPTQLQHLSAAGKQYVFRYYSDERTRKDILRPAEARAISQAGLKIGAVYEFGGGAPRSENDPDPHPEDFDTDIAERDAKTALTQAAAVGQPQGTGIYFAVDYDFTEEAVIQKIIAYFKTIAAAFSASNGGTLPYFLGVYGSGYVCGRVKAAVADVKYSWLAESRGWKDYSTYTDWAVKQYIVTTSIPTVQDYEDDEAPGDFGGFSVPVSAALHKLSAPQKDALGKLLAQSPPGTDRSLVAVTGDSTGAYAVLKDTDGQSGGQHLVSLPADGSGNILVTDTAVAPINEKLLPPDAAKDLHAQMNAAGAAPLSSSDINARVYASALHNDGSLNSSHIPGTDHGNLGCAWAVNEVVRQALGHTIGNLRGDDALSTASVYHALAAGAGKSVTEAQATPGSIIISPTAGNVHGHVGIVGKDQIIYSNRSSDGLFVHYYTYASWRARYQKTLGLRVLYYDLTS